MNRTTEGPNAATGQKGAAPHSAFPIPHSAFLGWCVHFYTALGLVAAAGIAVLLFRGDPEAFRWCFVLMLVATLIDATDGSLARAVRIKEVLPGFDGRRLDDLVDFLTYTCLPLLLIWRAGLLPEGWGAWLLLPLLASAYGFCQASAKTDDGYFLGFPSYWNLVAFYLYAGQPLPAGLSLAVIVVLALLTFVPSRYLYPTQPGRLNRVTIVLAVPWVVLLLAVLWALPDGATVRPLLLLSVYFPAYYLLASWAVTWLAWRRPGALP
ncbi:MAG TPA: CDP-alcohol phosphatidyltransferase [Gemmataceae bacterium]|jgi:phosphatidylcholine synthase|nr:CDP-alcohol phosphatidyltransferase [Gemmataceae bacterium]